MIDIDCSYRYIRNFILRKNNIEKAISISNNNIIQNKDINEYSNNILNNTKKHKNFINNNKVNLDNDNIIIINNEYENENIENTENYQYNSFKFENITQNFCSFS